MNRSLLIASLVALPLGTMAQSAIDAYSLSQYSLRGTARFMSMGGAFTALGGDISTLNQNPAGIGLYRSSDLSLTLDLEPQSVRSTSAADNLTDNETQTKFSVNNFGYVGAVYTGSETMPYFNWGVSYTRAASFDRRYGGRLGAIGTSLTNLVADYTTTDGYTSRQLAITDGYNPYLQSEAPWSSLLMFDAFGINPETPAADNKQYTGLYDYGATYGDGWYSVDERGHIDEYSINFGGNIMDIVYWGVGFGITDIDFKQYTYYAEAFQNPNVPWITNPDMPNPNDDKGYLLADPSDPDQAGDYGLTNYRHMWGSGFNFKVGVIVKPVNELRLGLAIHTPTYYNLSYEGNATMAYGYNSSQYENYQNDWLNNGSTSTGWSDFDWKLNTPWRLMFGVAGVLGGRAILSADYEYRAYSDMKVKDNAGYNFSDVNDDVKTYYRSTNILRLGAEYRVTPQLSLRAGYSYESSPVKAELLNPTAPGQATYVYTSGPYDYNTQPSYTLDRSTNYVTLGVGYKYQNFYADMAYVYRHRNSRYHAFTDYNVNDGTYDLISAPTATISDHNSQIVLTVGLRF